MIAQAVQSKEFTGRATERLVPSRATIKVITDNVTNATSSLGVTLKVSSGTPADWTWCREGDVDEPLRSPSLSIADTCGARVFSAMPSVGFCSIIGSGSILDSLEN